MARGRNTNATAEFTVSPTPECGAGDLPNTCTDASRKDGCVDGTLCVCSAGRDLDAQLKQCVDCDTGRFKPSATEGECALCKPGTKRGAEDARDEACKVCSAGKQSQFCATVETCTGGRQVGLAMPCSRHASSKPSSLSLSRAATSVLGGAG